MRILRCEECPYERSSEDDGKMFHEDPLDPDKLICSDCHNHGEAIADLLVTGKTTYLGMKIELK